MREREMRERDVTKKESEDDSDRINHEEGKGINKVPRPDTHEIYKER